MQNVKSGIKHFLTTIQHTKYQREVLSKKVDYDKWIRGQEAPFLINSVIAECVTNSQINDFYVPQYEGKNKSNDGELAKNTTNITRYSVLDESTPQKVLTKMDVCRLHDLQDYLNQIRSGENNDSGEKLILVLTNQSKLYDHSISIIYQALIEQQNVIAAYADEDVLGEDGKRVLPWLKPDWSPDTFLSGYYFGGLTILRYTVVKQYLDTLNQEEWDKLLQSNYFLYDFIYQLLLYNNAFTKHTFLQDDAIAQNEKIIHICQVLTHAKQPGYDMVKNWKLTAPQREKTDTAAFVSIIIPSKDHPEILFFCMESILKKTTPVTIVDNQSKYELIIVDNGSSEVNKTVIEQKVRELNKSDEYRTSGFDSCRYLYEISSFNFSKMCNKGAEAARGNYLLFLNDDMEVLDEDWLNKLVEKASLSYAGAVGCKLLYPDSTTIQHAGITNLRVGPAHKLQFTDDTVDHYYGRNRGVYDMLGVTGACLMVQKEHFYEAGGFDEELAVAFNDVDLCYRLFEAGYYNIQRNDVVLYHHESLSRGKDGESTAKQQRLLREKDCLYERHQAIYGKDPFYHPYLTTDMLETQYTPACQYQVDLTGEYAAVKECTRLITDAREDKCLVIGMECAMDLYKWRYGVSAKVGKRKPRPEEMGYYFQGYSFIIGSDNACYKKTLLLQNVQNQCTFAVTVQICYREDIKNNLKDQLNVDLTGYTAKVRKQDIPCGTYRFGMLAQDQCSRLKLVNWSSWTLEVSKDDE